MPSRFLPFAAIDGPGVVAYGSNSDRSIPFTPPLSASPSLLPADGVALAAGVHAGTPFAGGFWAGALGIVSVDGRGRGAGVAKVFMDGFSGASVSSGWGAGLGGSRVSGRGSAIVGEVGGGLMLVLDGGDVEKK